MLVVAAVLACLCTSEARSWSRSSRFQQDWSNYCPKGNPGLDTWLRSQPKASLVAVSWSYVVSLPLHAAEHLHDPALFGMA